MDNEAFMADMAEVLNLERGEISESTPLDDANWDSVAHLAAIAAIDERFDVTVPAKELTKVTTLGELLELVRRGVEGKEDET